MPTIKDKLYFNFDGKSSKDFGLVAISLSTGLYDEEFVSSRTINETNPKKRSTSIFHGIEEGDREFELELAFEDGFDKKNISDIIMWLFTDYYKPLYFEGQDDRVSFAMVSGDSSLVHNGLEQGYFTVSIKTNSPHRFSQLIEVSNTSPLKMTMKNDGHEDVYPELSIKKIGKGDLRIKADGKSVLIVNLENMEELYIDTMREKIVTDAIGEHRYDNIRAGELEDLIIKVGGTNYVIEGQSEIKCRYREEYLF